MAAVQGNVPRLGLDFNAQRRAVLSNHVNETLRLAEDVRAEPGNVAFEPHTERDNPNKYFVYEVYRDQEAFETHISAPYGAVFNARLNEVIEEDESQLTFLTRLLD